MVAVVPQPKYCYKPVDKCATVQPNGHLRESDDCPPRAKVKKAFGEGQVFLTDKACSIVAFSEEFIVKEELVPGYLQHLVNLKRVKELKTNAKAIQKNARRHKTYMRSMTGVSWLQQVLLIAKLVVAELDKCLQKHKLSTTGKSQTNKKNSCTCIQQTKQTTECMFIRIHIRN